MTILAAWLSRKQFSASSNRLIISLAISDLLMAPATLYDLILYVYPDLNNKISCLLRYVFLSIACTSGYYNMAAIAVDRYISIIYPLEYPQYVTKSLIHIMIAVIWSVTLLKSTIPLYWNTYKPGICKFCHVMSTQYVMGIMVPNFLIVWFSISVLYWKIWKTSREYTQRSRARSQEVGQQCNASYSKSNKVVLTILGCFSLCWLPFMIHLFLFALKKSLKPSDTSFFVAYWIATCNSGIDPFIYAWKRPAFRKAYRRLLGLKALDRTNCALDNQLGGQKKLTKTVGEEHRCMNIVVLKTISVNVDNETVRHN
ncbi:alpha-1A adrenergic receptor-like [Copidosoma floridanum]|uniref:alpha-1A adrenergic receptor-like n=1 Tax=Copidosoma floridanum TaxID=29053 RepID=UPI0006C996A3|nr:alpha-1A adrenergic receptor-like [Copidosoma floridanum]